MKANNTFYMAIKGSIRTNKEFLLVQEPYSLFSYEELINFASEMLIKNNNIINNGLAIAEISGRLTFQDILKQSKVRHHKIWDEYDWNNFKKHLMLI